jgi:hypothetical protein
MAAEGNIENTATARANELLAANNFTNTDVDVTVPISGDINVEPIIVTLSTNDPIIPVPIANFMGLTQSTTISQQAASWYQRNGPPQIADPQAPPAPPPPPPGGDDGGTTGGDGGDDGSPPPPPGGGPIVAE